MAPLIEHHGSTRRFLIGVLAVIVSVIVCTSTTTLAIDGVCYAAMTQKIPLYPGAQTETIQYNLVRAFGWGQTLVIQYSEDDPETVRNWYARTVAAAGRAARERSDRTYSWANARYNVARSPSGSGTQIILSGVCGM